MNDEENKNRPASDGAEAGGNPRGRNRRRRHRNGRKPENREVRPEGAPAEQNGEQRRNKPQKQQNQKNDNAPQERASGNNAEGNGNGRGNKSRRRDRRRGDRRDPNRGIADLYGNPTEADTLSLDELRAKIVVQAADGSSPADSLGSPNHFAGNPDLNGAAASATEEPVDLPIREEDLLNPLPEVFSSNQIPPEDRVEIIGVRFRASGKSYYFDPKGKTVRVGDPVIVDTARGAEFGEVTFGNRVTSKKLLASALRPLIRAATPEDVAHDAENRAREHDAAEVFYQKTREHKLEMKLIDVQYAFDNSKLLFYFTAEGRVDFRELVRDLAGIFHTRIDLRQIGIRDEAKLLGGLGACGRPLCCSSFLSDFAQVSIKMAKEQGLSLNSAKISGACGRLMCCLHYETASYAEEIKLTPAVGSTVRTPDGVGEVIGNNPIAATVRVALQESDTPRQYSRSDVTVIAREKKATSADSAE